MRGCEHEQGETMKHGSPWPRVSLEAEVPRHPQNTGDEQGPRIPVGEVEADENDERLLVLGGQRDVVVSLQPGQ